MENLPCKFYVFHKWSKYSIINDIFTGTQYYMFPYLTSKAIQLTSPSTPSDISAKSTRGSFFFFSFSSRITKIIKVRFYYVAPIYIGRNPFSITMDIQQ